MQTTATRPADAASTPAPEPLDGGAVANGYRRAYRLAGPAGDCWLQLVTVHVRYRCGDTVLVDYRARYGEWFRFARDGASAVDVHDFDLRRDGWSQARMLALLQRHGAPRTARWPGEPRLHVRKAFVLGRGIVQDEQGVEVGDGVRFGFLPHCAGHAAAATLLAHAGNSGTRPIAAPSPFPARVAIAGRGVFTAAHGHRTFERFDHEFACGTGTLRDRGCYRPARLP